MPSGFSATGANRQPVHVDDATRLASINFSGAGPGTSAPTVSNVIRPIIAAAATLTAAQSGALCLGTSLTGTLYTLPAPVVGLRFEFGVLLANTSGAYKIITNAGTVFLAGAVHSGIDNTTPGANPGPKVFVSNPAASVAVSMDGTTTGGLAGTHLVFECISATLWEVSGLLVASGTIATPFATT